jgi:glycosyltransferase involved in cell wall biosynthesis
MTFQPFVTAVMVTGKCPERLPLALAACESFRQQTYPHRELVIINTGENVSRHLADRDWDFKTCPVREHFCDPDLTLGELRNVGLEESPDHVLQWDDDDWSHPDRIAYQVRAKGHSDQPVTLLNQVRYSFTNGAAFVVSQHPRPDYAVGLPGTVLLPPTTFRYPAEPRHEDTHFLKLFPQVQIAANPPELYLRFEHGRNTWSLRHVMQHYANRPGRWDLTPAATAYLRHVLKEHYGTDPPLPAVAAGHRCPQSVGDAPPPDPGNRL